MADHEERNANPRPDSDTPSDSSIGADASASSVGLKSRPSEATSDAPGDSAKKARSGTNSDSHSDKRANPTDAKAAAANPAAAMQANAAVSPGDAAAIERAARKLEQQHEASVKAGKGGAGKVRIVEIEDDMTFKRRIMHAIECWSSSFVLHAVLIIMLAMVAMNLPSEEKIEKIMEIDRQTLDEEVSQMLDENIEPTDAETLNVTSLTQSASEAANNAAAPKLDASVVETSDGPTQVNLSDVSLRSFGNDSLSEDVGEGIKGEPSAIVGGYDEAMDRLTQEILLMLNKNKVLVVWLFDESHSMKDDQQEIKQRINKVYTELGFRGVSEDDDSLLTAVCSYGEGFQVHTAKPTSRTSLIRSAIDRVPEDLSGKELMCTAVGKAVTGFSNYATRGRRKLALIIVSDESGEEEDNYQYLEPAVAACKQARARVFSLGREAVFGYPYARLRWRHEETGLVFWRRINRGPETPFPEQLQTNGFHARWDAHSSGFGPYDQVRLCRETGGVFFMLPSVETALVRRMETRRYDLQALRPYLPNLESRADYAAERDRHPMRRAMWEVITILNPHKDPTVNVRHRFEINPATLAQRLVTARDHAIRVVEFYDRVEKVMEPMKAERDQDISPRWRANYDLLMAQTICYKVRLYEYAAWMDHFLKNPKAPIKEKTTHWDIATRKETLTYEETKDYMARATAMFNKIIEEHHGSPYAARAEWELRRGYGVYFVEHYHDPRYNTLNIKVPNP